MILIIYLEDVARVEVELSYKTLFKGNETSCWHGIYQQSDAILYM